MPGPWENYGGGTTVAEEGPWKNYAHTAEDGPWKNYAPTPLTEDERAQVEHAVSLGPTAGASLPPPPTPAGPQTEQQMFEQGLSPAEEQSAWQEAMDLREKILELVKEPTARERLMRSDAWRRLFGPSSEERSAREQSTGSPGEVAGTMLKFAATPPPPIAKPIRAATDPLIEAIPNETARGVMRGTRELVMSLPGMLATGQVLPAGRAVLAAFAGQAVWQLPEQEVEFKQALREDRREDAVALAIQAFGLGALFIAGAGGGAAVDTVQARRGMLGEPAAPPAPPERIAANLAAPGTLRPQEQRALGPPQAERPPDMVQFERVPIFNQQGEVVDVQVRPRIREIVIEEPGVIEPVTRGAVRESPVGGKVSFAADAPVLNREALGPRVERVTELQGEEPQLQTSPPPPESPEAGGQAVPRPPTRPPTAPPTELTTAAEPSPSPRPETITAPDARLGAESPDGRGLQMTERMAAAGAEAPAPVNLQQRQAGKASAAQLEAHRPPDILDFIQDEIGRLRKHTGVASHSQSLYDANAYRDLLSRRRLADKIFAKGGVPVDVAAQAAYEAGWLKEPSADALWERMEAAAKSRANFYRTRGGKEAASQRKLEQQSDNFASAQRPSVRREAVPAGELNRGAKFKLKGEDFEVRDLEFDPDTLDVTAVRVKDGPKFGDQTISAETMLRIDKGSLEQPKPDVSFDPEPAKPGLISGTAAEQWANDVLRGGGTHLGPDVLAAYVVRGAALIERGVRRFADWSAKMIAEHGDAIRPHLRAIFEQAQRSLAKVGADDARVKQRKLAARGSRSEDVAPEHRERLNTSPEAFYQAQRERDVRSLVAGMTNEELASVPVIAEAGPHNAGFAAKLELYRRLVAGGRPDLAWAQFSELLKLGTSMGQLINQLKQLKGSSPDAVLFALDRKLQDAGYDPLQPADRIRLRVLAGKSIKASAESFAREQAWKDAPTAENFERVREQRQDAVERDMDFQGAMRDYAPRNVWDTLTQMLQGNLLTPISLVANIAGNTVNLAWRGLARDVTAVTDRIDAALRHRERLHTVTPLRAGIEAGASLKRSLPEAWRVLYRGASDFELSKADARDPMKPLKAWRDMLSGQLAGPRTGGKLSMNHKLALALEMSPPAMTATVFLRTLGASDLPARKAALARVVTNEMKLRDLNRNVRKRTLEKQRTRTMAEQAELESLRQQREATPEQIRQAAEFPELYFDRASLARVNEQAATATYQQHNAASSAVTGLINRMDGPWKFLARTIVPYVQTPVNVIGEMLSFIPPIAAGKVMWHAAHGNARAAHVAAGRLVVGSMLTAAGYWLARKGLIGPSLDDPDEQQKARILSGQVLPPNHVNVTGLERALKGEDPTWRQGDTTRDLARGGGVAGALLVGMANLKRRAEKTPPGEPGVNQAASAAFDSLMLTLGYSVNQSFLKGTATALDAIRSQKLDAWFQSYFEGLTSIPLPNSLTALSRASREFKPELRDDSHAKTFANILKNRLAFAGTGMELPLKRDLWGRPVPETPEGANPLLYQFLDITKARNIPQDEVGLHLYTLWRKTANSQAIPTPPDKSLTVRGQSFKLTPEQHSQLQELVGGARRELAEKLIDNGLFVAAPAERQIQFLARAWEMGARRGKMEFWKARGTELDKRPAPAGFTLPE